MMMVQSSITNPNKRAKVRSNVSRKVQRLTYQKQRKPSSNFFFFSGGGKYGNREARDFRGDYSATLKNNP